MVNVYRQILEENTNHLSFTVPLTNHKFTIGSCLTGRLYSPTML